MESEVSNVSDNLKTEFTDFVDIVGIESGKFRTVESTKLVYFQVTDTAQSRSH